MKLTLKWTNLEPKSKIKNYLIEKVNSLDHFIKYIDTAVEAWAEIGRETRHHKKGNVWRAEIQIHLPGNTARAEAVKDNIFKAINEAIDELQRELKQYKGKKRAKHKRARRKIKLTTRLGFATKREL
jgi:putative sigma-54 modulation protein